MLILKLLRIKEHLELLKHQLHKQLTTSDTSSWPTLVNSKGFIIPYLWTLLRTLSLISYEELSREWGIWFWCRNQTLFQFNQSLWNLMVSTLTTK